MPPSHSVAQPAMDHLRQRMPTSPVTGLTGRGFLDTEFFHAAIEGLAAHAELARGLGHDVAVFGEHAFDGGPVEHRLVGARG